MKVNELREIIKQYSKQENEKIIVELYKRIPKSIKEDYNIDDFIVNLNVKIEKEDKNVTIDILEKQINYFLDCAMNNLYSSPNRVISKTERSKWRFKAKSFYKQLNTFLPTTEEGKKATDLLRDLFETLSYGSNYLIFSSWNTFGAIGVQQSDFLKNIVERKLVNGVTKENMEYCIKLLYVKRDPQEYHRAIRYSFESCLKTSDARYMAIEILDKKIEELEVKYKKKPDFENKERLNDFIECVVEIYFDLYEIQKGIKYFHEKYIEKDKEIKEYILLDVLELFRLYNEWILEYESKMEKINYRDSLKEKYEKIKNLDNKKEFLD